MSGAEIARKLESTEAYVSRRKKAIREKARQRKKGISKEDLEGCLREAEFTEEQIQRTLNRKLATVLKRASIYKINKVLRILALYRIDKESIINSLNVLVEGILQNIKDVLNVLLFEYKISKTAVEGALYIILSKGNVDRIRGVFEVLYEFNIEKSKIESCLSVLVLGEAEEIRSVLQTLVDNRISTDTINNKLYLIATGKASEIQRVFDIFQKYSIEGTNVVKNGLGVITRGVANDIERIIKTLQNNGISNKVIEEELSAIVNSSTPEEVEGMFNDNEEPKDKNRHYRAVRRYMKLKGLYGRVYEREEIEKICSGKHLTVKEFIAEVVVYPRGRAFTDIYYERLKKEGTIYIGGSTEIDKEYQEEHGEELIRLSKRIANTFALRTMNNDRAELEGQALEIILNTCGNLVYNLSHMPNELRAAMFNKTIRYLYSATQKANVNSLTGYGNEDNYIGQKDIPVADNVQRFEEERLASSIDYNKANFDDIEKQVMSCMVRLVEERRNG